MPASNNLLHNLRQKSESTKNIIAVSLAILPAILVGYAQFYMNEKAASEKKLAEQQIVDTNKKQMVGAVASLGKIFSEGKESMNSAISDLKKVDSQFLNQNSVVIKENVATSSGDSSATSSGEVIKVSE